MLSMARYPLQLCGVSASVVRDLAHLFSPEVFVLPKFFLGVFVCQPCGG